MAKYNKDFANWLCGFVDGEGTFSIKFELSQANIVRFSFVVAQKERGVLEDIKNFFGFGAVYERKDGACTYETGKRENIEKLIKFFREYPLRTRKKKDFEIWSKCFEMTTANEKKSDELLLSIANERMEMVGGYMRSKYFQSPDTIKMIITERKRK